MNDPLPFLSPVEAVKKETAALLEPEAVYDKACNRIQKDLAFDFLALQVTRPEEQVIETVYGTGIAQDWSGRVKHFLDEHEKLRDIQADIVLARPPRLEVIAGHDPRFDPWIYETYKHDRMVRVFAPIILVRDKGGNAIEGEDLERWTRDWKWSESGEERSHIVRRRIEIEFPTRGGRELAQEVIGTLEAGYLSRRREISTEIAIELTRRAARCALLIRQTLLPHVLDVIVGHAVRLVQADYASLHFGYDAHERRYIYEAFSGEVNKSFLTTHPPREQGLGQQAIRAREPKFIPDRCQGHSEDELKSTNRRVYDQGVRSMAAIPLLAGHRNGVLYIGFRSLHRFTPEEISWLQLFANSAVDAIRHATMYTQMREGCRCS